MKTFYSNNFGLFAGTGPKFSFLLYHDEVELTKALSILVHVEMLNLFCFCYNKVRHVGQLESDF